MCVYILLDNRTFDDMYKIFAIRPSLIFVNCLRKMYFLAVHFGTLCTSHVQRVIPYFRIKKNYIVLALYGLGNVLSDLLFCNHFNSFIVLPQE